jgi:hypothetical protein
MLQARADAAFHAVPCRSTAFALNTSLSPGVLGPIC